MKTTLVILMALLGLAATAHADPVALDPVAIDQPRRVQLLADELAEAAHDAHRTVERFTHRRRDPRALEALYRLDQEAHAFNRQVRRYERQPNRMRTAYRQLAQTYYQTQHVLQGARTRRLVSDDMRRIGRLLDRIGFVYDEGGSYRDHDDHRGHDYDDRYYDKDGSHGKNRKGAPQGQQPPVRLPRGTTTQQH